MASALMVAGTDNIINLLACVSHIKLLPGERACLFVKPGTLGKQTPTEAEICAIVMFQTNIIHGFLHNVLPGIACDQPEHINQPRKNTRQKA